MKEKIKKIKAAERESNISIYLGSGLFEIIVGLMLAWLVSFLIGLPIIMAYPYISPELLWILKILGWVLVGFGIIIILIPFIKEKVKNTSGMKFFNLFLKINVIVIFIFVPIGIFLALALNSEIIKEKSIKMEREEEKMKEKNPMIRLYFSLLFFAGIIHIFLGVLLVFLLPSLIGGYYELIYPYLNANIMNFLGMIGWICLITGIILFSCSFYSKKLATITSFEGANILSKIVIIAIISASIFLALVFPVGTFFGLTLIQEFYSLKNGEKLQS
ncbi:MAG: hypothetical protein ACTSR8_22240 [Promethearchaeota archaeon]